MIILKVISLIIMLSSMFASILNIFIKHSKSVKVIYFFNFALFIPILLYIIMN